MHFTAWALRLPKDWHQKNWLLSYSAGRYSVISTSFGKMVDIGRKVHFQKLLLLGSRTLGTVFLKQLSAHSWYQTLKFKLALKSNLQETGPARVHLEGDTFGSDQ